MSQSAQSDGVQAHRDQASDPSATASPSVPVAVASASSAASSQADGDGQVSTTSAPTDSDATEPSLSSSPTPSTSALPSTESSQPSSSRLPAAGQDSGRSPSQSHLGPPPQSPPSRRPPFAFPASSRHSAGSASYHSFFSSPLAPSSRSMSSSSGMGPSDGISPSRSHSHSHSHGNTSEGHSRHASREYKETLNAHTKDEKDGTRIINQYHLTRVIGQGAYGVVYKGCIQGDSSQVFAVKEFSKTRLRKSRRYESMRRPPLRGRGMGLRGRGLGGVPGDTSRGANAAQQERDKDPLELIRREIAIMKKLNHPHVITLLEALDDPTRDDLYMVLEYCPDGPIIDVKLHERHTPLTEEVARSYFVQILLGIEYLHHNDVIHRDIKPENILLCDNRQTCKIVDFGVSEMFAPHDASNNSSDTYLTKAKGQGTPAFLSPELCSPRSQTSGSAIATKSSLGSASSLQNEDAERDEREISGRRDDVWAFGVTFYCMVVGHLPFDKSHFLELYEAIRTEEPEYPAHLSQECVHLLQRFLTKDANERITLDEAREHPWVTRNGEIAVLPTARNVETIVEITEDEIQSAICRITSIFTIARAVSKFKRARSRSSMRTASQSSDGMSSLLSSSSESFRMSPSASADAAVRPSQTASASGISGSNTPASLLSGLSALGLAETGEHSASAKTWVTSPKESSSRLFPSRSASATAAQCQSPGSLGEEGLDQTPVSPIMRLNEGLPTVHDEPDDTATALPMAEGNACNDDRQVMNSSPVANSPSATISEDITSRHSESDHIALGEGTLSDGVKAVGAEVASMASAVGAAVANPTQLLSSPLSSSDTGAQESAAGGTTEASSESRELTKISADDDGESSRADAPSSRGQEASDGHPPTLKDVLQRFEAQFEHRMHIADPISATKHLANRLHQAMPLERLKHGLQGMGLDIFGSGSRKDEAASDGEQEDEQVDQSSEGPAKAAPNGPSEIVDSSNQESDAATKSVQRAGYLSAEHVRADDSGRNVVTGRKPLDGAGSSGVKVDKRTYMGLGEDASDDQDNGSAQGDARSPAPGQEPASRAESSRGCLLGAPLVHSPASEDISQESAVQRLIQRSNEDTPSRQ